MRITLRMACEGREHASLSWCDRKSLLLLGQLYTFCFLVCQSLPNIDVNASLRSNDICLTAAHESKKARIFKLVVSRCKPSIRTILFYKYVTTWDITITSFKDSIRYSPSNYDFKYINHIFSPNSIWVADVPPMGVLLTVMCIHYGDVITGLDIVSNHQSHDCLLDRLFRRRSKKTSKLHVTGLCAGNSPGTGQFPAQRASNAEMFPFDVVIMSGPENSKCLC